MMKLSEAIRLGSTLAPQGFGAFDASNRTCALGAAACAVGIDPYTQTLPWSWAISYRPTECPFCREAQPDIGSVVVHLNDNHRWTREQIADWVKTLEDRVEPAAQVKEEEQHVSDHETVGSY